MPAAGLVADSSIAITPGRSLRWAPDWDCSDARIAFDRNSGDYWALTPEAARLVRRLQQAGPSVVAALLGAAAADPAGESGGADAMRTLRALVHADLLRAWNDGVRVKPGAEAEELD